jgi:hypothetical protein
MYNTIRKIHLYAGLIILLFLMMYFVTGYVIIHRPFFGGQESAVTKALVKLHRLHHYGGGFARNAYIVFNDLASFSCILFALSGVYLWWKTARQKIWGILCLAVSCGYAITMITYLMYAR